MVLPTVYNSPIYTSILHVFLYFQCPTWNLNLERTLLLCSGQLVFIDESILMHMYVKLGKNSPFVSGIFGPKIHERNTMMLSLYVLLHAGESWAEIHSVTCPLPQFENHRKFAFGSKFPRGQTDDMYGQNITLVSCILQLDFLEKRQSFGRSTSALN